MVQPYFGISRVGYLQVLANRFGDFKVARGWKNEQGEILWTKHFSVIECWESQEGLKFLETVNNRAGLRNEIRIDLDAPKDWDAERIRKWFDAVCDVLDAVGIKYMGFHSGSRGYHLHIWTLTEVIDPGIKQYLCQIGMADRMKVNDTSMLTLEWAPNNKTGNLKLPIRGDFNFELDP